MKILISSMLIGVSLLSGCATITQGTEQQIAISTDPSGASCTLTRQGETIAVVKSTPGTITLGKSKNDVTVICTKENYLEETRPLASGFQGMTLGNILLGGIIGVAIDAGSGAMNKYPDSIGLILDPVSFPTAEARDSHYDAAIARLNEDADKAETTQTKTCENNDTPCKDPLQKIEDARLEAVEDIEGRRRAAKIDTTS